MTIGRRGEIGHGLEEWCDVQRHVTLARLTEPAPLGEHEHREASSAPCVMLMM